MQRHQRSEHDTGLLDELREQMGIADDLYSVLSVLWEAGAHLFPDDLATSTQWAMVRYLRDRGMGV